MPPFWPRTTRMPSSQVPRPRHGENGARLDGVGQSVACPAQEEPVLGGAFFAAWTCEDVRAVSKSCSSTCIAERAVTVCLDLPEFTMPKTTPAEAACRSTGGT